MEAFGGPCEALFALEPPDEDAEAAMGQAAWRLSLLAEGACGFMRIYRPPPTAAFTGSETRLPGYEAARDAVAGLGFAPVLRQPGGHLAIYDEQSLIMDIVAPHKEPRIDMMARFELFSAALAGLWRDMGIAAEVGPVPGEFCSGKFSINDGQGRKLAGLAQRITRHGYHLSALMLIAPSPACDRALEQAYHHLGLEFDAASQGNFAASAKKLDVAEHAEKLMNCGLGLLNQSKLI